MISTQLQVHVPFALAIAASIVIGLLVGSFLNVVVYRTPRRLSISSPRSFCPTCGRQLAAWENVPVISWLALRGRCHTCGEPISIRYPLVEAGTALLYALVTLAWHGTAPAIGYCVLATAILAIVLIDLGDLRAPLAVAAIGAILGDTLILIATLWLHEWSTLVGAQIGVVVGSGAFAILRRGDPECTWPHQYGRSALVPLGCWLGGLGALPSAVGLAVGGAIFLICLGFASRRRESTLDVSGTTGQTRIASMTDVALRRPLVVAVVAAATSGLLAFR